MMKPDDGGFTDTTMLELFRVEVENHTRVLEAGLVELEKNPGPAKIEPLMRAAHSIKGAARIIGLGGVVALAHAMEDLLSAARDGRLTISPGQTDLLLRGNDIFRGLAILNPAAILNHLEEQQPVLSELGEAIRQTLAVPPPVTAQPDAPVAEGRPFREMPPGAGPAAAKQAAPAKPEAGDENADFVRVQAGSLNRLMGLAGECMIQARSARSHLTSLARLKKWQRELAGQLEKLRQDHTVTGGGPESIGWHDAGDLQERILNGLAIAGAEFERFSHQLETVAGRLYDEAAGSRMRPLADGIHGFPRMVRDLARSLGKQVNLQIHGAAARIDRDILEKLEAPLTHLLRNAVDHGIEDPAGRIAAGKPPEGTIVLQAGHQSGLFQLSVSDDGRGVDPEKIRRRVVEKGYLAGETAGRLSEAELMDFLFLPGFTTAAAVTDVSGRGVGLDVVQAMVREVGGSVRAESRPGQGMSFHLQLPLTLSVLRTLLVEIGGEPYAIPLARIDRLLELPREELQTAEGRQYCSVDGSHIGLVEAGQLLQLAGSPSRQGNLPVVLISDRLNQYGLVVERLLGERSLVVRPLDRLLGKIPNAGAGAILEDGTPVLILDVDDLVRSIDQLLTRDRLKKIGPAGEAVRTAAKRILVVDDSLTVREVERRLLENRGYAVAVAVDGMDGWNIMQGGDFDLVITDVDMPRLNGIDFVRRLKSDQRWRPVPVMIVSYKDRDQDRMLGLEAGADYYLTKGSFHDESLVQAVRDLIGDP